ncbi:Asp-tRNA(Asn)/Glu-tRNA(Gln) amidotransferase subunit GatC [Parvibium lacunae]|uniref:Aspartyl/glutamyl-tRNA(Asn/Gln) amidotransferase subunit C n=1 Tax=Parvibium lacunae TaxID=1888893 RepID=A0A368L626_9BURK|nr:Asp-tRNA(Asn)/Glu-tRNA(Gln) amidotransferase subunit GatC [Parvibium lacunae]RCS58600.1 Asp-tRNA(Asn)/Glu-tRNA(Gln) amidotransferase subunit GatC [Parvibium lacunae]
MSISLSDVQRIAHLARLDLPEPQATATQASLNAIFGLIEQLQAVDTQGIEPLTHPVAYIQEVAQRLRPDAVTETNQREANQQSAPAVQDGLFLVPKVIE